MKDTAYAVQFDKKDYPVLLEYARKVRETHDPKLIDNFNLVCQRLWDDHHNNISINGMELLDVSKSDDLVVSVGTTQLINQILGTSGVRWQYIGIGTGTTAVSSGQTALVAEALPRADMSTTGWREYAGATLRFAGIFGETFGSISLNECGIFTSSTGGTMLNRNMFSNQSLTTVGTRALVISSIIDFVPIV
jgi:hypothetical protein